TRLLDSSSNRRNPTVFKNFASDFSAKPCRSGTAQAPSRLQSPENRSRITLYAADDLSPANSTPPLTGGSFIASFPAPFAAPDTSFIAVLGANNAIAPAQATEVESRQVWYAWTPVSVTATDAPTYGVASTPSFISFPAVSIASRTGSSF